MSKASVCRISFAFRLWLFAGSIILIHSEGHHVVQAAQGGSEAAEAPQPPPASVYPPSTIFFNQTKTLSCDQKEKTSGYITTMFLFNSPYAFGCLADNSSYFFSVALTGVNFPNTPVWLANRYHPVSDNASLSLTSEGNLLLQDSDGASVWSTTLMNNSGNPAGLQLTSQGNLICFDEQNLTLWESFSEPVDLLVPGQSLLPGGTLVAGSLSHPALTSTFTAVMMPGGLIFYENSSSPPLPYYALRYPLNSTNVGGVLNSLCNHSQLQLTGPNLTLIQVTQTPSCPVAELAITFASPVVFVRLEATGSLRGYYPDHSQSYDFFQNTTKGLCGIPNVCGPYGICDGLTCACPGNASSNQYFTTSRASTGFLLSSKVCTPIVQPLDCQEAASTQDHYFLELTGVDYFANDFIDPINTGSFEQCTALCADNCSCQAAFYRVDVNECYLHESVLSMIHVENVEFVAAIKLQNQSSSSDKKSEMGLIVGISAASLVSIFFFGVWYYHHKAKKKKRRPFSDDEDDLFSSLPGQAKRFSFKELQAATWEFSQKLGAGGFGSVYRGMFPDGSSVAVKQLENTSRFTQGMKEFRNEVIALSNINHQNLVHLRGFCADGGHRLLVYEYVPNGSLDVWLFRQGAECPGPALSWKTRLAIAVHTARGLVFLHEQCRNRIVHLDIKPQNILLDEQFVPKLADFGLSRLINEDKDSAVSRMRGTPGYMAPECLILTDATEKSDVYSFGMVLLEIVSGRKNVDVSRLVVYGDVEGWYFPAVAARKFQDGNVLEIIDRQLGQLGSDDLSEATRVIKIAFWCIQDDPSLRPTMGNALLMLEGYSKVGDPPLSYHFGMSFHLSNSVPADSHTPQSHASSTMCLGITDHQHDESERDAKARDQQNQMGKGKSEGLTSSRALPLSFNQASPPASPGLQSLSHRSVPGLDGSQASFRSPTPPGISSPRERSTSSPRDHPLSSHQMSPRRPLSISSPSRTSPFAASPLSRNSLSPFCDNPPHSRHSSSVPLVDCHSPISSPLHV